MCSGKILSELVDEPMHVKMVFTVSEMLANRQPTIWKGNPIDEGEFITSRYSMMELCSTSERETRTAFKRLVELGEWQIFPIDKRHTRIRVLSKVPEKVLEKVPEKVLENKPKNSIKSSKRVPEKVLEKVPEKVHSSSGVSSAVGSSSPAFDVSHSGVLDKVKGSMSARTPTAPSPVEKFKIEYNRLCPRLIGCRELNDRRRKKIRAELVAHPDDKYWAEVFTVANKSAFMAGDNDRKWRANFDFILRCHVEIVEGKYSRPEPAASQMPREIKKIKQAEVYREPTSTELAEMHRETVLALGRCHLKSCQYCGKVEPAARELEELSV